MALKLLDWVLGPENIFCNLVSARSADAYNTYSGLASGGGYGRDSIVVRFPLSAAEKRGKFEIRK